MRVYHFLEARWALDDLRRRRLRISNLMSLNDPFEFMALALPSYDARSRIIVWRHKLAQRWGVVCFSGTYRNPLLWSHYAQRHAGVCLGFDLDDRLAMRVEYVAKRAPEILLKASAHPPGTDLSASIRPLLATKFKDWAYEDEVRTFAPLDPKGAEGENFFLPFSENLVLREVALGFVSKVTRADVEAAYGTLDGIDCFKTRLAFNTFRVVRNRARD